MDEQENAGVDETPEPIKSVALSAKKFQNKFWKILKWRKRLSLSWYQLIPTQKLGRSDQALDLTLGIPTRDIRQI